MECVTPSSSPLRRFRWSNLSCSSKWLWFWIHSDYLVSYNHHSTIGTRLLRRRHQNTTLEARGYCVWLVLFYFVHAKFLPRLFVVNVASALYSSLCAGAMPDVAPINTKIANGYARFMIHQGKRHGLGKYQWPPLLLCGRCCASAA